MCRDVGRVVCDMQCSCSMCVLCMIVQNVCLVCGLCDVYMSDVCTVGCVQVYGVCACGGDYGHAQCE